METCLRCQIPLEPDSPMMCVECRTNPTCMRCGVPTPGAVMLACTQCAASLGSSIVREVSLTQRDLYEQYSGVGSLGRRIRRGLQGGGTVHSRRRPRPFYVGLLVRANPTRADLFWALVAKSCLCATVPPVRHSGLMPRRERVSDPMTSRS